MAQVDVNPVNFTKDEAEVYDRQIRLWGIHAQQKIRSANVAVFGLSGLASEVIKNIVLVGINSITLIDENPITEIDCWSNLFTRNQVGINRAQGSKKAVQELNPMVQVNVNSKSLTEVLSSPEEAQKFLRQFNVVLSFNQSYKSAVDLNEICRQEDITCFTALSSGSFAMVFYDLGKNFNGNSFVSYGQANISKNFAFTLSNPRKTRRELAKIERFKSIYAAILSLFAYIDQKGNIPSILNDQSAEDLNKIEVQVLEKLNAVSEDAKWSALDHWYTKACGESTYVNSIVGGCFAQDIIRSITKEYIEFNMFLFDGLEGVNIHFGY